MSSSFNPNTKDTNIKISRYANVAKVNNVNYLLEFVLKDTGEIQLYSIDTINKKEVVPANVSTEVSTPGTTINSITHIYNISSNV